MNGPGAEFAPPLQPPSPQAPEVLGSLCLLLPALRRKYFRGKMAAVSVYERPVGGFSFDNCRRNAVLEADFAKKGYKLPAARKTGTTIAGVVYKDGIVLGADTRATEGMVVADKNCSKIHFISPNIYCCGAGTAADTDMTTQLISSNLELHSLSTGRLPRVVTANRMLKQMLFRYQGYIGAALVLGGVDVTGPHLYSIYPHGSTDKLPYVTMGSGSLAAMAVFEDKFRPDMEVWTKCPESQRIWGCGCCPTRTGVFCQKPPCPWYMRLSEPMTCLRSKPWFRVAEKLPANHPGSPPRAITALLPSSLLTPRALTAAQETFSQHLLSEWMKRCQKQLYLVVQD
uniref:proteasome endopeptidase complex n=1 Tax=Ailuropoda melanoleuca TaxID=9646 RepID=A0A7N5KHD2_AILME